MFYGGADLERLGNTRVTMANSHGELVDITPPTFFKGLVATPTLSASGHHEGTDLAPVATAELAVSDTGAGIRAVSAAWCLADGSSCFYTVASASMRGHLAEVARVGGSIAGAPPGTYLLRDVDVFDQAGNWTSYVGEEFGGDTDYAAMMPGGHAITITP